MEILCSMWHIHPSPPFSILKRQTHFMLGMNERNRLKREIFLHFFARL